MSRLKVDVEIDADGACVASMTFRKQEIEAEGSTPSEALQSLAEELALFEGDDTPVQEDVRRAEILQDYMS